MTAAIRLVATYIVESFVRVIRGIVHTIKRLA
jgi:hypothetical protein